MTAVPDRLAMGGTVNVRLEPFPLTARLPLGTKAWFKDVALASRLEGRDSGSLTVKKRLVGPLPWLTVKSVRPLITGGSLTARTVRSKLATAIALLPSVTVTVIVVKPSD